MIAEAVGLGSYLWKPFFLKHGHGFSGLLIPLARRYGDALRIYFIGLCDFP